MRMPTHVLAFIRPASHLHFTPIHRHTHEVTLRIDMDRSSVCWTAAYFHANSRAVVESPGSNRLTDETLRLGVVTHRHNHAFLTYDFASILQRAKAL